MIKFFPFLGGWTMSKKELYNEVLYLGNVYRTGMKPDEYPFYAFAPVVNGVIQYNQAKFRVDKNGILTASGIDVIGSISGRSTDIIAGAIDAAGHFIDNALKTSTKEILDGFRLTSSGALNISGSQTILTANAGVGATSITVSDTTNFPSSGVLYLQGNTNWMRITYTGKTATTFTGIPASGDGSITEATDSGKQVIGGPGIIITPKGLVAINSSGVETIILKGATGDATFAGTLSAVTGTLGALTIASGGNVKLGQTAYDTGTGFWLGDVSGTPKLSIGNSAGNKLTWDGSTLFIKGKIDLDNQSLYGNGSDGDITISSNTTLTRDMYYNNLTINSGVTLNTGGYRIFVKGTLTNNGTISRKGNDGASNNGTTTGAAGGAALSTTYLGGSGAGGAGGNASSGIGTAGSNVTSSLGANGGTGGTGSGPGGSGGAGGTITSPPVTSGSFRTIPAVIQLYDIINGSRLYGGAGGGGGGGSSSTNGYGGGGGGSGGGIMLISARNIVNNGTITVAGGNGGNGYKIGLEYSGGGGGGGGGYLVLIYNNYSGTGIKTANGGIGGGPSEAQGANGSDGTIIELQQ